MKFLHTLLDIFTPEQRRASIWILSLMFVGMVLETLGTALVIPLLSLTEQSDPAFRYPWLVPWLRQFGIISNEQLIFAGMMALVGVFVVKNLFLAYFALQESRFVFGFQASLSQRLFTTYLRQPYTFHLQRNSALLIRNTINEVGNFNIVLSQGMCLIAEGLVVIGISTLLLIVEPLGAVTVILILAATSLGFHYGTRAYIYRWGKARQYHEGLRIKHLQQGLGSIKDVKLLGRETDFLDQYATHNTQSTRAAQYHATLKQLPRLWLEVLVVTGIAALVLTLLARGGNISTIVPTLGLFSAAAFRLMPSANRMLTAVQSLRYGLPVVRILHDELQLGAPAPRLRDGPTRSPFQHEIRLSGITYTYPNAPVPALDGVSLSIRKGECVGLIGPSGSGKSTLVDVILGLLAHDAGQLTIDGQESHKILRAWQDQIGYVPQSIYLTDDTLRRNVAFGLANDRIDDQAVLRAIRAANLEEFTASQLDGLETVVGERGIRLSGGQRQRVGIARALYHDPAVLVLDEATSALDTQTEREVMQAVMEMQGDKTILIVAHRFSTVEHCDRLYRMESGKLMDAVRPAAMLAHQEALKTHGR